jgi:hypothetical protein
MYDSKFADYWHQAEFCYFKAEAARGPASKHLWIQMAQDWIALAENLVSQTDQAMNYRPEDQSEPLEPLEQLEPFLVA